MNSTRLVLLALVLSLTSCNSGLAAIFASSNDDSTSNAPSTISAFTVEDVEESPARVHFRVIDADTGSVSVSLFYLHPAPGSAPRLMSQLDGAPNPQDFAASGAGTEHTLSWDYAAEPDLPANASFVEGVTLWAQIGADPSIVLGANGAVVGLGNDAPELTVEDPLPEVLGVVPIRLTLSDSSDDVVAIRAAYQLASEPADVWHPARPAGLRPDDPTPDPVLVGQVAPAAGRELLFFWDTDFDLADLEREVRLSFTPEDGVATGLAVETSLFQVDNNAAPAAILQDGVLATSPDETGAIAVLFSVLDEESDPVRVLFQWRHAREESPDLSALSRDQLLALLDDPDGANQREELQICMEEPLLFEGRAQPPPAGLDPATHVTLADLAGSAASLLESGRGREPLLANRTLEILRAPASLEPVAAGWPANPLQAPVAALPVQSGPTALVLDAPASASWRLREIDLGNGAVVRDGSGVERVASSAGDPSALAYEGERRSVLVASDLAGNWQVDRVDLATWSVTRLVSVADGTTEGGRIRAIASLGLGASLITVGGSLVRLDYPTGAPQSQHQAQAVTLLDGFETPWGIALDPLQANRMYLAERDYPRADGGTGRVTTLELDTYLQSPVFVRENTLPGAGLERPTSIALERHGARLLVVTDDGQELRGIEIGGRDPGVVFELPTGPGPKVSLATGSDGMRILALTEANELAVAGGMLERRSVVSYDPRSLTARVSAPFDPAPGPNSRWRIAKALGAAQSSPEGRANLFVWNSRDVPEGDVHLRIVPLDTDRGVENEAILPKRVRSFRDPKILGGLGTLDPGRGLEAVDVDNDGRLDVVASSHGFRGVAPGLAVFLQSATGSFSVAPAPADMTLGSFGLSVGMLNLAAADLNADGRTDLVGLRTNFLDALICPNAPPELISGCHPLTEDSLLLFLQPGGGFLSGQVAACEIRQDSADLTETQFLRIADLDQDRRPDLVMANGIYHGLVGEGSLALFYQDAPQIGEVCSFPALPDRVLTGGSPVEVTVADLNADGRLDLVSTPDRNLGIHFQAPAGGFLDDPGILLPTSDLEVRSNEVAAADWNGDGRLDLASFFIAVGSTTFGFGLHFQPDTGFLDGALPDVDLGDPLAIGGNEVIAADVDGDDRQDVVAVCDASGTLAVFLQGASGRFSPGADIVVGGGSVQKAGAGLAADLDGDGRMDLAMTGFDSANLAVFSQVSPGTFGVTPDQDLGTANTMRMGAVAAGDLDGDGRQDLIVPNPGSAGVPFSELAIFLQKSTGGFFTVPDSEIGTPSSTPAPRSVVAGDLDGDGRLDLAAACAVRDTGSGNLAVFLQSPGGAGAFENEPSQVLGGSTRLQLPGSLLAADLDADGQLDLVCANEGSDLLTVFRQVETGRFSAEPVELGGIGAPVALVAADLDTDGRVDLASANGSSNDLTLFFQPPGGFVRSVVPAGPDVILGGTTSSPSPSSIAAEDLDGDGWLDLAAGTDSSAAQVVLFLQPRTGFASGAAADSVLVLQEPCNAVVLVDLNLDGLPDLAAATGRDDAASAGAVLAFFQRSSGFADQADLVLGQAGEVVSYSSLVASDLNNDGEPDLAAPFWRNPGPSGLRGDRIALFFGGR